MNKKLFLQAILKFVSGVLLVGLLVFLPAGTLRYFQGWLFMGILFVPMFVAGIVMMAKNPKLLESRLNAKEKQMDQGLVVKLSGLMFLAAYVLYAEVLRENTYLSRTIEVQENQKVIDTGLYGIVRHPMYFATVLLFLAMPLVLGALISFVIFLVYPFIIAKRIRGEEQFLERELTGYREYKEKVKYRLIPFIW